MQKMKLYFSPLACSLATRIAFYEGGIDADYEEVDGKTKKTATGTDFLTINELGLVPTLRTKEGELLTENAAILQYVNPELAPRDPHLHQWLCFIGTELHKGIFAPLLDKKAPEEAKAYALAKVQSRLDWVAKRLEGRTTILEKLSVADAYLFTVLNWTIVTPIEIAKWPAIASYMKSMHARPAVAKAFAEERALYMKEQERQAS
jgi:glutathione S-transferase